MSGRIDFTGQRFGRLVLTEYVGTDKYWNGRYRYRCDCGNMGFAQASGLRSGTTKSCGCLRRERTIARNTRHGLSGGEKTPTHLYRLSRLLQLKSKTRRQIEMTESKAVYNPAPGAVTPVDKLKNILNVPSVQEQFKNALAENRNLFIASLIDLYASDKNLQQCDPAALVREALKAAVLQLPIAKSLGFAWIVPYKGTPVFQLGYRGYIQLALRTGVYRFINADAVYEGELRGADKLTGLVDLSGEKKSNKILGYFAYLETVNGFKKAIYWTRDQVTDHAKKFSPAFGLKDGAWQTNFDAMAIKTVIRQLISRYGIMSIEMQQALSMDFDEDENDLAREVAANANRETIVIDAKPVQEKQRQRRQESTDVPAAKEPDPTPAFADPGF